MSKIADLLDYFLLKIEVNDYLMDAEIIKKYDEYAGTFEIKVNKESDMKFIFQFDFGSKSFGFLKYYLYVYRPKDIEFKHNGAFSITSTIAVDREQDLDIVLKNIELFNKIDPNRYVLYSEYDFFRDFFTNQSELNLIDTTQSLNIPINTLERQKNKKFPLILYNSPDLFCFNIATISNKLSSIIIYKDRYFVEIKDFVKVLEKAKISKTYRRKTSYLMEVANQMGFLREL